MNSQNSQPAPRRTQPRKHWPKLLVVGLILVGGAWIWNGNFSPQPSLQPKMAAAQDATEPDWEDATDAQKADAQKIIVAQLDAFKADDWEKAVTFQSAGLRQNFGSTKQFEEVIKKNYPEFASYKSVKFGKARSAGELLQIQVSLTGKDGGQIAALYSMIKEPVDPKKPEITQYRVAGVSGGSAEMSDTRTA